MRRVLRRVAPIAAFLLLAAAAPRSGDPWGAVASPSSGPPRVIGSAAAGCIAGAARLPAEGTGFEVIRVSRHRYFGHPDTIAFVERLGRAAAAAGLAPFYVGDMAQPRGGPMTSGHGSHQTGLDVDIWFNLDPKPMLAAAAREDVPLPSMLLPDRRAIDPARFGRDQIRLLRLAAADPRVDRIFVNPVIKRVLCERASASGQAWLHKIRPWYGHDEHFHVRLSCPPSSPACIGQAPVPKGDGCDATLAWWLRKRPSVPAPAIPHPPPHPKLPRQCLAVLGAK